MPATGTLTVTQAAWTEVKALSFCNQIRVTENRGASGFPNGDFLVLKNPSPNKLDVTTPPPSNTPARIQSGAQYTFVGRFAPGTTAGHLQMVGAITTAFDQDESSQ